MSQQSDILFYFNIVRVPFHMSIVLGNACSIAEFSL